MARRAKAATIPLCNRQQFSYERFVSKAFCCTTVVIETVGGVLRLNEQRPRSGAHKGENEGEDLDSREKDARGASGERDGTGPSRRPRSRAASGRAGGAGGGGGRARQQHR